MYDISMMVLDVEFSVAPIALGGNSTEQYYCTVWYVNIAVTYYWALG